MSTWHVCYVFRIFGKASLQLCASASFIRLSAMMTQALMLLFALNGVSAYSIAPHYSSVRMKAACWQCAAVIMVQQQTSDRSGNSSTALTTDTELSQLTRTGQAGDAGLWIAAAIITATAEVGRASGLAKKNTSDGEAALKTTASAVGAAAAAKVAWSVATKAATTAVAFTVAAPTAKAAGVAVGVAQAVYEGVQARRAVKRRELLEEELRNVTVRTADARRALTQRLREQARAEASMALSARLARVAIKFDRRRAPNKTSSAASSSSSASSAAAAASTLRMPVPVPVQASRQRLVGGALVGAALGYLLPRSVGLSSTSSASLRIALRQLGEAALAAVLASSAVRSLCRLALDGEAERGAALARAAERATVATETAAAAEASLRATKKAAAMAAEQEAAWQHAWQSRQSTKSK